MAYSHFNTRSTPQSQPVHGKNQVKNDAGGFVFQIDSWARMERFLILGAEGGTYYVKEKPFVIENAQNVIACIAQDGGRAIRLITDISQGGRAPKNTPALFALALATADSNPETRRAAWRAMPLVARTGTDLFQFAEFRQQVGGWGRLARNGMAHWYQTKTAPQIAYQALKYAQRNGWTHRDILRLCHATGTDEQNAVFHAITHPDKIVSYVGLPSQYEGVALAKEAKTAEQVCQIIADFNLTREMIPTEWLNDATVYEALLQFMPMTAMIRNLGNMSKLGLLSPMSAASKMVCERLRDQERLKKARVHPLSILTAARTYAGGKGLRGKGEWTVVPQVVDALDDALELSFGSVEPTGKSFVIGVDVSSSMTGRFAGSVISSAEVAAVLALVTAKTEENYFIGGFTSQFVDLKITAKDTFVTAARKAQKNNFGNTDCAVPMLHAMKNKIAADAFLVITDNETWYGSVHPFQALKQYREQSGINAKSVVLATSASRRSIADPSDPGMLDVVGMDTSVPQVIADFVR